MSRYYFFFLFHCHSLLSLHFFSFSTIFIGSFYNVTSSFFSFSFSLSRSFIYHFILLLSFIFTISFLSQLIFFICHFLHFSLSPFAPYLNLFISSSIYLTLFLFPSIFLIFFPSIYIDFFINNFFWISSIFLLYSQCFLIPLKSFCFLSPNLQLYILFFLSFLLVLCLYWHVINISKLLFKIIIHNRFPLNHLLNTDLSVIPLPCHFLDERIYLNAFWTFSFKVHFSTGSQVSR